MPPSRISHFAKEPVLAPLPPVKKDSAGYGVGAAGFGLGSWGLTPGSTGIALTPLTAVGVAAAWACVNRISADMGKLSRRVMKRLPKGGSRQDFKHPLNHLLRFPNPWQNPTQFWGYLSSWVALRGNAYVAVLRNDAGEPSMLIPLSPDRCSVMVSATGELYYQVTHPTFRSGQTAIMHRDNMMHVRSLISFDGYTGISPIAAGPDVFGVGVAAQQHAAVLFRQGTRLSGVLQHPGRLNPEARAFLREEWKQRHEGVQNAFQIAVVDEGMKFQETSMTSADAQLLEARQFSVVEVCRMFGVPPHKVYDLSRAHFANMEQGNLEYWSDTLQPLGKQMIEEASRTLLFSDEQDSYYIDIDYDELMRTDRKTRYTTDEIGIRSGRLTQNEARISDGREPNVPGGDDFLTPLNMATSGADGAAGAAGRAGSAKPDSLIEQDEKPAAGESDE
jgi:HK97 family phage portal protein